MAKYNDAIRDAIIAAFNAGDQPTEAQFTNWITRIQEGIDEHDHTGGFNGDGTLLDWDQIWSDAVHDHSVAGEGGQLDWDDIWSDAVHSHLSAAEGGTLCNHVSAKTDAGQNIVNNIVTTIVFEDEDYDTGAEYVAATGIFTAQRTGYLHVTSSLLFDTSVTWGAGDDVEMYVYVAGATRGCVGRRTDMSGANIYQEISGSATVYVTVGQTVTLRVRQRSGGNLPLLNVASYNTVQFDWLI